MRHLESELQRACMRWLCLQHPKVKAFAIPNGGARSGTEAAIMQGEGVRPGVPDICIPVARGGYHALYIEFKHGRNKPTIAQNDMMEYLREEGCQVAVCYSIEDFITIVSNYLQS